MDASQWKLEANSDTNTNHQVQESRKVAINCPRCNSSNTTFCYYNNYSLTQPRYFCKACRRYWTQGGSLRNVPVGGGSRKNKRSSSTQTQHDLNFGYYHHGNTNHLNFLPSSSASYVSAPESTTTTTTAMHNSNMTFSVHEFKPTTGFPSHENGDDGGKAFQVIMNQQLSREGESGSTGYYWN